MILIEIIIGLVWITLLAEFFGNLSEKVIDDHFEIKSIDKKKWED